MSRLPTRITRLVTAVLAVVLVAGCASSTPERHRARLEGAPTRAATVDRSCDGLSYRDVLGQAPSYGGRQLRRFPGRKVACRAMWLPHLGRWFVPQAMELDGHTAWISGYRWRTDVADRACRLLHVRLRTGRVLADQALLVGAPGDRKPTFCRHGGGLELNWRGLWIAEKERLWLVDPRKVGTGRRAVLRVWAIRSPVFGSTTVIRHRRLGLAYFRRGRDSGLKWFRIHDLMRPGVLDLVGRAEDRSQLAPVVRTRIPGYVQGMTYRPGHRGLLVSASRAGCGVIVLPGGRSIAVMPGLEDFAFTGHNRLWALSESSTRIYQRQGGPVVPTLTKFDARKVLSLPRGSRCR